MRCYICDAPLGNDEIKFNRQYQTFDPCGHCREIISLAARETKDPYEIEDDGDGLGEWDELISRLGLDVEEDEPLDVNV